MFRETNIKNIKNPLNERGRTAKYKTINKFVCFALL
jgi:hypothetical protein